MLQRVSDNSEIYCKILRQTPVNLIPYRLLLFIDVRYFRCCHFTKNKIFQKLLEVILSRDGNEGKIFETVGRVA